MVIIKLGTQRCFGRARCAAGKPKEIKMRILIAGAGVVGTNLAEQLSMEGHEISLVDSEPEVLRPITDKLDVLTVVGSASSLRTL